MNGLPPRPRTAHPDVVGRRTGVGLGTAGVQPLTWSSGGDALDVHDAILVLAIHRRQSVSAAARDLYVSQSAASRRLKALERRLGVELFVRRPDGAVPTPVGHRLAAAAVELIARARAAVEEARGARAGVPRLRVGIVGGEQTLPGSMLLAASVAFRAVVPAVRTTWWNLPFGEQHAAILEGNVDVVVTVPPLRHPDIRCMPLFRERRVVASADQAMREALSSMTSVELAQLPLARAPHAPTEWMAPYLLEDVRPLSDASTVMTTGETALDVLAELQITRTLIVLPERVRLLLGRSTDFVVHPLDDIEPVTTVAAVHASRVQDPLVQSFTRMLVEVCATDLTHHLPFGRPA